MKNYINPDDDETTVVDDPLPPDPTHPKPPVTP